MGPGQAMLISRDYLAHQRDHLITMVVVLEPGVGTLANLESGVPAGIHAYCLRKLRADGGDSGEKRVIVRFAAGHTID